MCCVLRASGTHHPRVSIIPNRSHRESFVTRVGWFFVAGQVALDPEGNVIGVGDPAAQTEATLDNLVTVLTEGGATLDDVVRLTVFLTDIAHLPAVQEVRARYFPNDPPVSSTIEISGLVNPELVVEIDAIAVVDAVD